jgi:hypothetical protein
MGNCSAVGVGRGGAAGRALVAVAAVMLAACGGSGGNASGGAGAATTIGVGGGTVTGPAGASVTIPAGALTGDVAFRIVASPADAPAMTVAGASAAGQAFAITPHGTSFSKAVTVSIPFDAGKVPSGQSPTLLKAEPGGAWSAIAATVSGGALVAQVTGFSFFAPVAIPVQLRGTTISGHCLRETLSGQAWCWGEQGMIAAGSGLSVTLAGSDAFFVEPVRLPPRGFGELVAGPFGQVCGISNGFEVWCIGDTYLTRASGLSPVPARTWVKIQTPAGVDLYRLSMGGTHACAIGAPTSTDQSAVGKVFCWGDDLLGQLGRGGVNPNGVVAVTGATVYATVAAGGGFTCATQAFSGAQVGGTVDCWGSNIYGAIAANAGIFTATTPYPRGLVVSTRPGALAAFASTACGIKDDGTAYCWGDNFYGEKGDGTATTGISGQQFVAPSAVTGGHLWKQIAPGDTSCGIDDAGVTWCWGYAPGGSLGNGLDTTPTGKQTSPVQVAGPDSFAELSSSLCGRTAAGEVSCWGSNRFYDLGLGQDTPALSNVPVPIKAVGLSKVMP